MNLKFPLTDEIHMGYGKSCSGLSC